MVAIPTGPAMGEEISYAAVKPVQTAECSMLMTSMSLAVLKLRKIKSMLNAADLRKGMNLEIAKDL